MTALTVITLPLGLTFSKLTLLSQIYCFQKSVEHPDDQTQVAQYTHPFDNLFFKLASLVHMKTTLKIRNISGILAYLAQGSLVGPKILSFQSNNQKYLHFNSPDRLWKIAKIWFGQSATLSDFLWLLCLVVVAVVNIKHVHKWWHKFRTKYMIPYHTIMNSKIEGFFAGEIVWKIYSILIEYRRQLNMH